MSLRVFLKINKIDLAESHLRIQLTGFALCVQPRWFETIRRLIRLVVFGAALNLRLTAYTDSVVMMGKSLT